ncbi:hypothetical protein F2Q69_00021790 [Brassica cretica]|uniref:Uncharacterized protein n=1 Tax=Brassica cretica TaxID=69181 RepID=A0A8S9Q842_BRACR|nr:hypothetical protein F2Q69_00021790 [Brassica cretica]
MKTLGWREFKAKPKPEAKEERQIQRNGRCYGLDRCEESRLRWERTSSVFFGKKGDREGFEESGQVSIMDNQSVMAEQQFEMIQRSFNRGRLWKP